MIYRSQFDLSMQERATETRIDKKQSDGMGSGDYGEIDNINDEYGMKMSSLRHEDDMNRERRIAQAEAGIDRLDVAHDMNVGQLAGRTDGAAARQDPEKAAAERSTAAWEAEAERMQKDRDQMEHL